MVTGMDRTDLTNGQAGQADPAEQVSQSDHKMFTGMIPHYLAGDLREKDLMLFLEHVKHCHPCYEELETAFMVDRTVRYLNDELDDDAEGSYNLPEMMQKDIADRLVQVRRRQIRRRILMAAVLAAVILAVLAGLDFFGILPITRLF